jgi:uncharacterized protein YecT (DUF1311 family)
MRAFVAIVIALSSSPAFAGEIEFGCPATDDAASYEEIMTGAQGMNCQASESNIGFCMARDFFVSEIALAKANHAVLETMEEPSQQAAFATAEKAWCSYRDAICDWEPSAQGGSMSGQLSNQCRKERNERRIKILRDWVACITEGSCENPPLFFKIDEP